MRWTEPANQSSRTPCKAALNSIRTRRRIHLFGHDFVTLILDDYLADVVRSLLNIPQDLFILVVPLTFGACLNNCTPITSLLTDSSSFSRGWSSSTVTAKWKSMGFLARRARSPSLHFAKALSFSVCVQVRFSIPASRSAKFSRARLAIIWAEPVEVDAFEWRWTEPFPYGFSRLATSHERAETSDSKSSERSRSDQQLGSLAVKCLSQSSRKVSLCDFEKN